jgi:DNA-binding response OmpR family regulator
VSHPDGAAIPYVDWENKTIVNYNDSSAKPLSSFEYHLLVALIRGRGRMVSHEVLKRALWRHHGEEHDLKIHKFKLARKIPWPIKTIHGRGYLLHGYTGSQPPLADEAEAAA